MAFVGNRVLICMGGKEELERTILDYPPHDIFGTVESIKQAPIAANTVFTVRGDDGQVYQGNKECFYTPKEFEKAVDEFKDHQNRIIEKAQRNIIKLNLKAFDVRKELVKPIEKLKDDTKYLFVEHNCSFDRDRDGWPCQEHEILFYSLDDNKQAKEKTEDRIWQRSYETDKTKMSNIPPWTQRQIDAVYSKFREDNPGKKIVVLKVFSLEHYPGESLQDRVENALRNYRKNGSRLLHRFYPDDKEQNQVKSWAPPKASTQYQQQKHEDVNR